MFALGNTLISKQRQQESNFSYIHIFDYPVGMASSNFNNKVGNQRCDSSSGSVHYIVSNLQLSNNKRGNKMGAKIGWIIADWLGIPLSLLGIYFNLDNIKSTIIAILSIIYLMMRIYFYYIKNSQSIREKEYDLWHREIDKEERKKKFDQQKGK